MKKPTMMRGALGAGLVAAALALSACSGAATGSVAVDGASGTGSSVTTAAPTTEPTPAAGEASIEQVANNTDPGAAMQTYIACLAKNGVKMSMPSGRPSGMPSGRPSGMPSGKPSAMPSGRPTGAPSGGMPGMQAPAGVSKAKWAKAQKACASLLPKMPSGGAPRQ